jgi:DNA helicase-2/ATP-dependent DNA helicase PcrA
MTEVVRISGAPGCGKTTRLIEHVAEERDAGADLGDIHYVTFSRSAVEETRQKLADVFDVADDSDAVDAAGRTFHSLALSLVAADIFEQSQDQIIQRRTDTRFYEDFANRHGLRFDANQVGQRRPGDVSAGGRPSGNRFFDVADQLRLRDLEPSQVGQVPIELPRSPERLEEILNAWAHRKRAGRKGQGLPLYEHSDYVHECIDRGYAPRADVLFIDEFQDLSPLEYNLYKTWRDSGALERIYIAGDANQSIYGSFRAARPKYFRETPVDREETLRASWRCPAEVVATARCVLDADRSCDHGDFVARDPGGTVETPSYESPDVLASAVARAATEHGDVFVLARTNYQVSKVGKALRNAGVPHQQLGAHDTIWNKTLGRILLAVQALRDGRSMSADAVQALLRKTPGRRQSLLGTGETSIDLNRAKRLRTEQVRPAFDDVATTEDIIGMLDLPEWRQTALEAAYGHANDLRPSDVRIGTIHSAKGLETPCVFLFEDSTPKVMEAYHDGKTAEEHRLYYVGVTRASEELRIVREFFDTETFPVFERFERPVNPLEVVV